MKEKILIVDDEYKIREMITMILEHRGYEVVAASNGHEAIILAQSEHPDLILMDVMMPIMNGFDALKKIRNFTACPVIMLTAKGEDEDQVTGLEGGADDYIIKPFTPMVLSARIAAQLRRAGNDFGQSDPQKMIFGDLVIDQKLLEVTLNGEPIELKRKEFDLLVYMARNHGIALSVDQILEKVWGYDYLGTENTVYSHMNRLRKKLDTYEKVIKTVRGYGYKFEV
ncbi:MAG: response regulator transcription factor [Clostridia bacterium]|nr:response regulator transcription factor [Clostridia bacterium]